MIGDLHLPIAGIVLIGLAAAAPPRSRPAALDADLMWTDAWSSKP